MLTEITLIYYTRHFSTRATLFTNRFREL